MLSVFWSVFFLDFAPFFCRALLVLACVFWRVSGKFFSDSIFVSDFLRLLASTVSVSVFFCPPLLFSFCLFGGRPGFLFSRCSLLPLRSPDLANNSKAGAYVPLFCCSSLPWPALALFLFLSSCRSLSGPPAVESSIAVEDAVENRGLYRVFVSRLF